MHSLDQQESDRPLWISWGACLTGIALVWLWWWTSHPVSPDSTGGETYSRMGGVLLVLMIPTVLSALRLSKIDDRGSPSMWLIPVLLAIAVVIVSLLIGYLPDKPGDCARLVDFEISPPYCSTIEIVRTRAWVEAIVLWLVFGGLTFAFARRRRRKARRDAEG